MLEIYPTHTCFDDALDFIVLLVKKGGYPPAMLAQKYRVVHGLYQIKKVEGSNKTVIAHAWVLDREHNEAIQETVYTLPQVARLNAKHNNYGPWEPLYLKHCRGFK